MARACHFESLFKGNQQYTNDMATRHPNLLQQLAREGQFPPFAMFLCSDSRLSEQAIFSTKPGTIFTSRNIANVFIEDDLTSTSVLGYAVDKLKVKHVIVMGHYGCGGVAASMVPPPPQPLDPSDTAISTWISPIRELFATSTRPEIVAYRQQLAPNLHNAAFRALVEENVKMSVQRITASEIMKKNHTGAVPGVFAHGWVTNIENGVVSDLGVSVGPPNGERVMWGNHEAEGQARRGG
ncbi:hypothetical protein APHAL10511_008467 [Amanita phalloides]|nr:hypothetical protein APHAL10511_008467 [Amanita phalloides]